MTREEKDLLLKDLCARLPYGVIGSYSWKKRDTRNKELTGDLFDELTSSWNSTEDSEFLPYLRPMSSMKANEVRKYISLKENIIACDGTTYFFETYESIDWLNKNMFDYRGLIPKGLADVAPEDMYNL